MCCPVNTLDNKTVKYLYCIFWNRKHCNPKEKVKAVRILKNARNFEITTKIHLTHLAFLYIYHI